MNPIAVQRTDEARSRAKPARLSGRAASVLVVEDEQIVALELRDRLMRMGHAVVASVASGEAAIEAARRFRPDLVLMDIKLHGAIDGVEAATAIRKETDAAIVYLTAFADDDTLERAKVTQPYGYIIKPFRERELHVVIEVALYRRTAERELREAEIWRHALLRSVGDAVVASDASGCVKFMNALAESLTGWSEAEAIGRPLADVLETVQLPERRSGAWRDSATTNLIRNDGDERPIELEITPILDDNNKASGTVCVFRDVSERRRRRDRQRFLAFALSELGSSLERDVVLSRVAALIVRNWADWCAIHVADERGELQLGAFAHRSSSDSLAGFASGDRTATIVEDVLHTGIPVLELGITERDWPVRAVGAQAEGLTATSAIIVPLRTRNRCVGTMTVVSERPEKPFAAPELELARELGQRVANSIDNAQLYAGARRATRMRDDVLAVVSHDLRNPLSTIMMRAEQLRQISGLAPELVKPVAGIQQSAERMARLIDDLLDVARVDSGQLSVELTRVSAASLVGEALAMFEAMAAERSIRLESSGVVPADLLCDHGRVLQVLSNLVGNALKFSPEGATISIAGASRAGWYELSVADRGTGIAPDRLAHVFERHWQAPETKHRGSGLGLYICKGIVDAHGGRIWAESVPDQGSVFHFTVPLAVRSDTPP